MQGYDPGVWGASAKADDATLAKRKIVRARRGPGGTTPPAEAAPAALAAPAEAEAAPGAGEEGAAAANPFAGRTLAATAPNPFAGVSLVAAANPAAADKVRSSGAR